MAPEDPSVKTLVDAVTAGGRSSRRKKLALVGLASALVVGGGAFAASRLMVHGAPPVDAAIDARRIDARSIDAREIDAAIVLDATIVVDVMPADAARADARVRGIDAAPAVIGPDAAPDATPPDATPPDAAAPPAPGTLLVKSDAWCELFVDGQDKGRVVGSKSIAIPAGDHTVTCKQSTTGHGWSKSVAIPAGGQATLDGQLLGMVTVTFAIAASLDGTPHQAGDRIQVKAGSHTLGANGHTAYPSVIKACIVREPLDCYVP